MGTDINVFLEYKSPITKEWEIFGYGYYIPRNYEMFSRMAGVRSTNNYDVLYTAKGIPDDLSEYVKEKYDEENNYEELCHNPSWLNKNEFAYCIDTYSQGKQAEILEYKALLASMVLFEEFMCESRIVFWFML